MGDKSGVSSQTEFSKWQFARAEINAFRMALDAWKGTTEEGFCFLVNWAKEIEAAHTTDFMNYDPNVDLVELFHHYESPGNIPIGLWWMAMKKKQKSRRESGEPLMTISSILEDYRLNVLPFVISLRVERQAHVQTLAASIVQAQTHAAGVAEDFRNTPTENSQASTSKGGKGSKKRSDRYPPGAYRGMREIQKRLMKNPHICPNCFDEHALSECTEISEDPRENPAAYLVETYEEETKRKLMRHLKAVVAKLKHL